MREILFRGKRIDNGEWVEGKGIDLNFNDAYILTKEYDSCSGYYMGEVEVIPDTVGQFTGLTDKNLKKIFEGDIVSINEHEDCVNGVYAIAWDNENHCWKMTRDCLYHFDYFSFSELNGFNESCEVIGNIHDNPELLEDK